MGAAELARVRLQPLRIVHVAPWSLLLRGVSFGATLLLTGVSVALWVTDASPRSLCLLPVGVVAVCLLFVIRGYTVVPGALEIHRLLWTTRIPLKGLKAIRAEPEAMRGSLRLCGNGGLFSFTGWFRNRSLGLYRAFVTDTRRTVVLSLATRTLVVSPADPEAFVRDVEASLLG
ncbi:MAG: hypothetical protein FJ379_09065 [Verrucomicrobia bacterium]|nr:hypothetical protein [Verrucomicrobiota bacterium]